MLSAKAIVIGLFGMVMSAVVSSRANAALPIEFEFRGGYTQTTGTIYSPGDTFVTIVRFDPAAPDNAASPTLGDYDYLTWTAPRPTSTTPIVFTGFGEILTGINEVGSSWSINNGFSYVISIAFPPGTFADDSLPPTLNLALATRADFSAFIPTQNVDLRGSITSLLVRGVPEPTGAATLVPLIWFSLRRRTRA